MKNDKKKILKTNIKINEFQASVKSNILSDKFNIFYSDIIKNYTDNLWLPCISTIFQYFYLISFVLSENVSITNYIHSFSLIQF